MADRATKERKLVALMFNDLEANMDRKDFSRAEEEARALPDDELNRMLATRLDLPDPDDEEALDSALLHVEEPEVSSGSPGTMTGAPDMSHEPGPGERTDD